MAEIAPSLVLATQAGWLIQRFAELHAVDLGFCTMCRVLEVSPYSG